MFHFNTDNILSLNSNDKEKLGKLILSGKFEKLIDFCEKRELFKEGPLPQIFAAEMTRKEQKDISKQMFLSLIQILFPDSDKNQENIQACSNYIHHIFSSTPDEQMSELDKKEFIVHNLSSQVVSELQRRKIQYIESPPPLEKQDKKSTITFLQYQKAIESRVDKSDYIILTDGLIRSLLKKMPDGNEKLTILAFLEQVEKDYFHRICSHPSISFISKSHLNGN